MCPTKGAGRPKNKEDTNMKNLSKEVGARVTVHDGTCSMGGMFITETFITGAIAKINAKSIRLNLEHLKMTRSGKSTKEVVADRDMKKTATFPYWKTVDGREFYKNKEYGVLEF
jgi:hypothetical protein